MRYKSRGCWCGVCPASCMHSADTVLGTGESRRGMGCLGSFAFPVALFPGDKDAEDRL